MHLQDYSHLQKGLKLYAPYSEEQMKAMMMGTIGYNQVHPENKVLSGHLSDAHYKSLVQPTMSRANKSMAKNLGMPSLIRGSKNTGLM